MRIQGLALFCLFLGTARGLDLATLDMIYPSQSRRALTLVEMLVGMAITLIMMAAVVNLFANVSGGVSNRRAAIEMNGTLRQARGLLQRDLAGATCPAVPWQNPEAGNGYLEIIEGRWSDYNPSELVNDPNDTINNDPELDYATSIVPSTQVGNGRADAVTDGRALGDYDDILALTVRSDDEPFVGTVGGTVVESNFAEVIWYSIENPASGTLGEPGLRTVYRRVLLVAPWITPPNTTDDPTRFFQDNDISAHYESGRWVPNTLSDLTKRENRFLRPLNSPYPYALVSAGVGYTGNVGVQAQRTSTDTLSGDASIVAISDGVSAISGYRVDNGGTYEQIPTPLLVDPAGTQVAFAYPVMKQVAQATATNPATFTIAAVTHAPPPLALDREGEDVILNDVLAWDVRVFDPGATLFNNSNTVVGPTDLGWLLLPNGLAPIGYGDYVDLGWNTNWNSNAARRSWLTSGGEPQPLFSSLPNPFSRLRNNRFTSYDTWSTHYESDGLNQDQGIEPWRERIDQGTDGFDNDGFNGTDDIGERETTPPYDVKLPAVKVIMRAYERDSRQIRETSVTQSFQ